nr:GNAT family N-acetyltransferase [Ktedonobacterales bacterium]
MSDPISTASHSLSAAEFREELPDGLLLRWSTHADSEGVATLYGSVFRDKETDPFNEHMARWTRDWLSDRHPYIGAGDIALVEDQQSGRIVAATGLLSYDLEYGGIRIPFAQPEIVATLPEYRNRGLIRRIFALIHARSATRGHLVQGITGIPYYYRQFGYEYAVELDVQHLIHTSSIPPLKDGETEPFTLRPATSADIPQLQRLYDAERQRGPISSPISDAYWHWLLEDGTPTSAVGMRIYLIIDDAERVVGYTMTGRYRWGDRLSIRGLWLAPGVSWAAVALPLLR